MLIIKRIINILYPIKCVNCKDIGNYLCSHCFKEIHQPAIQKCAKCNRLSTDGLTHPKCQTPLGINGIYALSQRNRTFEQLIKQLKYQYTTDITPELVGHLSPFVPTFLKQFHLLIPIPLHPSRYRWRGFNHAETICKHISQKINVPYAPQLLTKTRTTTPQAEIKDRQHRLTNLKNAFSIHPQFGKDKLKGKDIVLVDDVTTTGTTLNQAAKPLKQAGAASVWGLVLTR